MTSPLHRRIGLTTDSVPGPFSDEAVDEISPAVNQMLQQHRADADPSLLKEDR